MRIILKHTIKNMIVKPLRTIVLIVCIAVTALAAYLMIDMTNSLSSIIRNFFTEMVGSSDINIMCGQGLEDKDFEGLPEFESVKIMNISETLSKKDKDYYSYVFQEDANVFSIDLEAAYNMGIFKEKLDLKLHEVAISETFAKKYEYKIGDSITLHDKYKAPIEFKLVKILPEDSAFIAKKRSNAVVNLDSMKELNANEPLKVYQMFVDVKDDSKVKEFIDEFEKRVPSAECSNLLADDSLEQSISQITSLFTLLFIVAFLLVIFITVSLSNRIICERMSVIGTFRSLGISSRVTTFILLMENVIYGLLGAAIGTALYQVVREPLMTSMVSLGNSAKPHLDPMAPWMFIVVFSGAILVECVAPIFALTKAVRTAIRDIIFANKDTEYVLLNRQIILGVCFLMVGIICGVFGTGKMVILVISLISVVVAIAILMPLVLKWAAKLLTPMFKKLRMPVASLASSEICSKKSTVSSAVLCATAVSLAITIYIVSTSLSAYLKDTGYKADVIMLGAEERKEMYSFVESIEGVKSVDYVYDIYDMVLINGESKDEDMNLIALPNKETFKFIPDLPDSLEKNQFMMNEKFAKKYGIKIGDTVKFTLKANALFPLDRELTLTGYVNTENYVTGPMMVLNADLYIEVYHDYPSSILVNGENPEYIKKMMSDHIFDVGAEFYTADEYQKVIDRESGSMTGILSFMIILGVVLTMIGTSGNQIIGFEGRRREYAVMYSTAMNRKQIKRLIFLENMISTGVAVFVAIIASSALLNVVARILDTIDMYIPIQANFGLYIVAGFVFWIVLMFTCLSPMKALRKMNIAAELKYE